MLVVPVSNKFDFSVLGCCPGGTGSNFWCLLLNGDINLSITMTFVSTVAALGMMPFWLLVLGSTITDGDLVIPYTQLVSTLLTLVGPIALGMWIRYRFEKGAKIMKAIIVPTTLLTVLFIFTAGIYINLFIFMLMTGKSTLFRNKRFALNKIFQRNASKFAIFYV